ncbi:hypothetical protein DL98DRAFT_565797 [Cadophora sp. DSE1049]|nr:hypothetical protein DL98DRAFT_565797 [Cadophora sp. DSE1049]
MPSSIKPGVLPKIFASKREHGNRTELGPIQENCIFRVRNLRRPDADVISDADMKTDAKPENQIPRAHYQQYFRTYATCVVNAQRDNPLDIFHIERDGGHLFESFIPLGTPFPAMQRLFFHNELQHLEYLDFDLVKHQALLPIDAMLAAGQNLRYLGLSDQHRKGADPISLRDLRNIRATCLHLTTLRIDLPMFPYHNIIGWPDRDHFEAEESLELLATIPTLSDLETYSEMTLGTFDKDYNLSTDQDYDDAEKIMRTLHADKLGVPFERLLLVLDRSEQPPILEGTTWSRSSWKGKPLEFSQGTRIPH